MAKRKKRKFKSQIKKAVSLASLPVDELMKRGSLLLGQEKFLDAIACYKHLLKLEQRKEFLQGLEQAYKGRIMALAAKSMYKEAIALLDVLVQRFQKAKIDLLKFNLLLQAGDYTEAASLYDQCQDQLAPKRQQQIEALFGALLLADNDLKLDCFSADSAIARIYPNALAAIDISCSNQKDKLEEVLRQIPIRSPYRDLRTLLNGLYHFPSDKAKGSEILGKIDTDSPYHYCAATFLATADSPKSLLAKLAATPKADRSKLPGLHGVPVSQIRVLQNLAESDGKPIFLFKIVRQNEHHFGKANITELYRNILPFCNDQAVEILARSKSFRAAEKYRLCALAAEHAGMSEFAITYWTEYLDTIDRADPTGNREIAMVMRHQVKLMKQDRYEYSAQEVLDTMLKSLEYDPGHAQTWLDSSEYARRFQSAQQHYAIIQDAVLKLPEEVSILLAAMKACSNRGAHKKAAGLAGKVLALDPINTAALDFQVASHLEHGRKLASQKKWALAEKELLAADTRARSIRYKGRSQICLGMLLLLQNNDSGLQHIEQGRQENPYPLFGHILVALEARLYGLPKTRQKGYDRLLKQYASATKTIDSTEFHRLISWVLGFEDKQWPMLKLVCQLLKGYFSTAVSMDFSLGEGLSLCRALEQIELPIALFKCSASLVKKHPDVPEFRVWNILASALRTNTPLTFEASMEMEDLFDELVEKNQFDFIEHIENILEKTGLDHDFDFVDDDEEDFFIDFGPFGPPKNMPDRQKTKTPSEPKKPAGKQLNLFDDDL